MTIDGRAVLGVIPARGGSKGIPRKNVLTIAGKPLIAWTIEAAKKAGFIDRLICSTDDQEIASVAKTFGAEAPFERPFLLASDTAATIDVIIHALDYCRNQCEEYPIVCTLQCTSPLRSSKHLVDAAILFEKKSAHSVIGFVEMDHPPFWAYTLTEAGTAQPMFGDRYKNQPRQAIPKAFRPNGAVFLNDVAVLRQTRDFFDPAPIAMMMDRETSIDIDDMIDFHLAEFILKRNEATLDHP